MIVREKNYKAFCVIAICLSSVLVFLYMHLFCQDDCISIPVSFNGAKKPLFTAQIEKTNYVLGLDLGAYQLSLDKDELAKLKKTSQGIKQWEDGFGNKYESLSYIVPNFRIKDLKWENIKIIEEEPIFDNNTTLWKDANNKLITTKKTVGGIGRIILHKTNLLLDFPHSKICACNNISKLKKKNYDITNWIQVPFMETQLGMILEIDMDFGLKRLIFDTGCTVNFMQPRSIGKEIWEKNEKGLWSYTTSKFVIGSHNFANKKLYQYEFSKLYDEVDGFLGMSFIEDYQIYIDYPNRMIYINPYLY